MTVGNLTLTISVIGVLIFILLAVVEIILLIFAYNNIKGAQASPDTNSQSAQSYIIAALVILFLAIIIVIVIMVLGIKRGNFTKGLLYGAIFVAIFANIIVAVLVITATNKLMQSGMYQSRDSLAVAAYEQLVTGSILIILSALFVILMLGVAVTRTDTENNVKKAVEATAAPQKPTIAALPAGSSYSAQSSSVKAVSTTAPLVFPAVPTAAPSLPSFPSVPTVSPR